jgi:hypothetical protein
MKVYRAWGRRFVLLETGRAGLMLKDHVSVDRAPKNDSAERLMVYA